MGRPAVVPVAPGIWRVPLVGDLVNGFLLRDDDGQVTVLDMGMVFSAPRVLAALEAIGSGPSEVTRLLLTHAHEDHAGGAAALSRATGRGVSVHAADAPYAAAGSNTPRGSRLGRLLIRLRPRPFPGVEVAEELHDGQVLEVAGRLRVIHTPGHTPGHAAYLHEPTGTLITGDSIFNVVGLRWSFPTFCSDFRMSRQTAVRLTEIDYETAAFTHGKHLVDAPQVAITSFLAREGMLP